MGPEDTAAGEVPVPQSTASAIECGVDAGTDGFVNLIGFARARCLPVKGEAEDQHDEASGSRQGHGQRGIGTPALERIAAKMNDGELAAIGGPPEKKGGAPGGS